MRGIARADGLPSGDYEAVVLAFSRLSHAVVAEQSADGALKVAAETGTVLLQADSGAACLLDPALGTVEVVATFQMTLPKRKSPVPAEAVVRQCVETGSPIVIANVSSDCRKGLAPLAKQGVVSILCVPLKVRESRMGALIAMSKTEREFTPSDTDILSAIADQAAFVTWKSEYGCDLLPGAGSNAMSASEVELIELANRKIQELSIVNKISEAVISTLDLAQLLSLALDQCLIAVSANVGSIMLVDDSGKKLAIETAKGLSPDVIRSAAVNVGEGIAGWVAQHGQPVLVHDARNDARFQMHAYRDGITSAMSVPLKARGRVIGVLNASTIAPGQRFGPREVEFLSVIANQVAMAIDNAQLYERLNRRSQELASLLHISEAITSTLELREVLALLAARFREMAQVDASALLVFDADTDRFRCLDGQGLTKRSRKSAYLELSMPIATQTLQSGAPVSGELQPDSPLASEVATAEGFSSAVCVPLTAAGRIVGVVALFSRQRRAFAAAELSMLNTLGGLAGVAVHNALIYQHKYEIARSLQFQLVPKVPLEADGLETGHKFLPAREVGGDYYDLIKVAPGQVGVVIADVAGNSVPAAMYTSMGKHVLRAYALEQHSPGQVLKRLNRIAFEDTHPEVFISVFYGLFDARNRIFRYACAGHEPALLYRPDGSFESLRADGLLVGISPHIEFEEKEVHLDSGSILVLYTDGLVDSPAVRGKFGVEEIKEIVTANALKTAQELADNIYTRLMEVAGSRVQDDVALVVLKVL